MPDGVYTIDEIREMLAPLLLRYRMDSAGLFGSYARGEATPESDIDIIVRAGKDGRNLDVFGVAEGLHRASGKAVDVFEIDELKDGPFRDRVIAEMVSLCKVSPP